MLYTRAEVVDELDFFLWFENANNFSGMRNPVSFFNIVLWAGKEECGKF